MEIEVENIEKMKTLGELFKVLKNKYDLNYKGWEGFEGLFECYQFKKNRKKEYYELNTYNIRDLITTGKTFIKEW